MFQLNLVLRLLACSLLLFVPLSGLDRWIYDLFFRLRVSQNAHPEVVLVTIDDSRLLEQLSNQDPRFSPNQILFDPLSYSIWFDQFYHKLTDQILGANPKLIVFSTYYDWVQQEHFTHKTSEKIIFSSALNAENKLIPPPRALTTNSNYGFNNLFPDGDSVVRKTHLIYSSGMSLALRVFQTINNTSPLNRNLIEPLWIDFRGPTGNTRSYDGLDVASGMLDLSGMAGKVVLVGREENYGGFVATPVGRMPKIEVLANTIETFLQNREIRMLPKIVNYAISATCIAISVWMILTLPLNVSWLMIVLSSGLLLVIDLVLFSEFKIWTGVANPLVCFFGTHLLVIGFQLGRQEEKQWRLTQQAEYFTEMDQFKNNFISLFSHDLKTPIAKIKAITDRLLGENPELPAGVRDSLKTLDKTNGELARFISDILKVTKMESMVVEPVKEVVDLNRLVEESVSRLKFLADEKTIEIVSDLEPLFSMEGDQKLLQEVMINLIENAIKYSDFKKKIIVRTREEIGGVRFTVIDEGPGIDSSELPRVTGKFYRGKEASEKTKGSGLGLYLAKYFVELHGGKLTIESVQGLGTTASFTLPLST